MHIYTYGFYKKKDIPLCLVIPLNSLEMLQHMSAALEDYECC